MHAIFTVDVEADGAWNYGASSRVTVENLSRLPRFQALCDHFGVKPTYLCTWEVARDDRFADMVRWQNEGRAEIGSHLHPWTTPPFAHGDGAADYDPSEYPAYPSELPLPRFRAKLERLTALIEERSGRRPTTYRAGRWGMAAAHVPILVELGYTVDCSVTPLIDRTDDRGVSARGPDYRSAPLSPYRLGDGDLCVPGPGPLLEVPVTIVHPNLFMRRSQWARDAYELGKHLKGFGRINRVVRLDPLWLRPSSPGASPQMMRKAVAIAAELRLPVAHAMVHSSELFPGGAERASSGTSVERVFEATHAALAAMAGAGARGVTLRDYAAEVTASSAALSS